MTFDVIKADVCLKDMDNKFIYTYVFLSQLILTLLCEHANSCVCIFTAGAVATNFSTTTANPPSTKTDTTSTAVVTGTTTDVVGG